MHEPDLEPQDGTSDDIETLLAQCLAEPEERRREAIESACSSRPELATELRSRLAVLRELGIDVCPAPDFPEQLGDFRLIRVLGGGGMGVVYLAVQTSLRRDVALKLIRPEHLFFEGARRRFRREAEAVARLQHPGIVPIYAVGESGGIPYLAMELVRGSTLARALSALKTRAPESLSGADLFDFVAAHSGSAGVRAVESVRAQSWIETCLLIARQTAEALQHAHEHGLVHRDVKPSNIALTPDGRALLLDFGLTRMEGDGDSTRTGARLGTLSYMSPEQVRGGREVDARSDVYSLGVTLYEMLALQVPYRGDDEQTIERLVLEGRPEPIRPRNRRVEHDVETVVMCALDVDCSRRYATCADFARDLGHLLAHRPIEARRPGPLLRSRRWVQRHPAAALGIVVIPALVLAAAVTFAVRESSHSRDLARQLTETRTARDAAHDESVRANQERETAERALDFVVGMFSPRSEVAGSGEVRTVPELFAHGEELVEAELGGGGPARARMLTTLAKVFERQGNHDKALELCTRARVLWRTADRREDDPYLAQTLTLMAEIENRRGRVEQASLYLHEALGLYPDTPQWAGERKTTYGDLARIDTSKSGSEAALAFARAALERGLAEPNPDPEEIASRRADLGLALLKLNRTDEAAPELEAAMSVLAPPGAPASRDRIALITNLADVRSAQERDEEAIALSDRGIAMALSIRSRHCEDLGIQYSKRARFEEYRGHLREALEFYRAAVDAYDGVFPDGHPQVLSALGPYAMLAGYLREESDVLEVACRVLTVTAGETKYPGPRGQAFAGLASIDGVHKDRAEAEQDWSRALCCYHAGGSVVWGLDAYLSLAKLRLAQHDVVGAEVFLESALASALESGRPAPKPILQGLAEVCRLAGHESAAVSYASRLEE